MGKNRKDYPNTPWGREAKWEDEQRRVEHEVNNETPREYVRTYDEAVWMLAQDRSADDIRRELYRRPRYDPRNTSPPGEYELTEGLAKVRLEAIQDALAGKPARHHLK